MSKVDELKRLLSAAVERSCESKVGIVFSGGIDSLIIAILSSRFSEVTAYACGLEGASDLEYAKKCEGLGFDVRYVMLEEDMVEDSLRAIISAISDRNPVKVSVEVPFYFASKHASEDGLKVMLCGQGADELFGGYARYIESLKEGYEKVEDMMRSDIERMYESQLSKDMAVCKANRIELRAPYMDPSFIDYVLSLPMEDRIRNCEEYMCVDKVGEEKYVRKYILRLLGKEVGVPDSVLHRKKKAAQYGSGTQKMLEKIARKKNYKKKASEVDRTDYVRMYLEEL
ncbi:MAG: asparagine synthase C-terminal domain-containing protein [Candidatus Altiarchaeota archaeon]|nr:asparagine synthase C-terminal domain-containing protein [Candidatus Altiarchaeota archaeon]